MPIPRPIMVLIVTISLFAISSTTAIGEGPDALTVVERAITQDHGCWQVDYRLRYGGTSSLSIRSDTISARVEGWVSNSRIADHATPRPSVLVLSGAARLQATADLIASADEERRCRESATLQVWADEAPSAARPRPNLDLVPGAIVRVRLLLEHHHLVYGAYDPLLGLRTLRLCLGSAVLHDSLPLDSERHVARAESSLGLPAADRRDTRHYVSAPHSLHLDAQIPDHYQYRFPEQPVRYATKMRLSYWYLIAPGTQGEFQLRLAQYRDSPISWKPLTQGDVQEPMATMGRWVHVERVFRTEAEATTLAIEFRLCGADVGEVWIDDVTLESVDLGSHGP